MLVAGEINLKSKFSMDPMSPPIQNVDVAGLKRVKKPRYCRNSLSSKSFLETEYFLYHFHHVGVNSQPGMAAWNGYPGQLQKHRM
jgi:hypothetical protein